MRFFIFVIVLKLLLNLLSKNNLLYFNHSGGVEAFELEPFLENDYLQSELGMSSSDLDEEIDERIRKNLENIKAEDDDQNHEALASPSASDKEPSLPSNLPTNSNAEQHLSSGDTFVAADADNSSMSELFVKSITTAVPKVKNTFVARNLTNQPSVGLFLQPKPRIEFNFDVDIEAKSLDSKKDNLDDLKIILEDKETLQSLSQANKNPKKNIEMKLEPAELQIPSTSLDSLGEENQLDEYRAEYLFNSKMAKDSKNVQSSLKDAEKFSNLDMTHHLTPEESLVVEAKVMAEEFKRIEDLTADEMERKMEEESKIDEDHPGNIIEPHILPGPIDFEELHNLQFFQRRIKDTYALQYIEEDLSFPINDFDVQEWQQLQHDSQEYLVGRGSSQLYIINPNDMPHRPPYRISVGKPITALETFTFWNFDLYREEGIIAVACIDKLLWFRNNPARQRFEIFGQWELGGYIKQLAYFRRGEMEDHLIVGFNHTILQIFKFHLDSQKYWMTQELYFDQGFEEFITANTGREIVLALSQEEVASVYIMNPANNANGRDFHLQQTIVAPGISAISTFSIGGLVYLALSGYKAQILIFDQGEFHGIASMSPKFGKVDLFYPIPMTTKRDDLMLLVYYTNDLEGGSLVQNLQWNGRSFEASLPVPCRSYTEHSKNLQCLLDSPLESLLASSPFARGNEIYLIVPGFSQPSKIFHFQFELLNENSELMDLLEYFIILKEWFKKKDELLSQVEEFLETPNDVLIHKALDEETASLDWVETPEFQFYGDVNEIYLNDHLWSREDSEINLDTLINLLEDLDKSLESSSSSSPRQRRDLGHLSYDQLELDSISVKELEIESLNGQEFYVKNGILEFPEEIEFDELTILEKEDDDDEGRQRQRYSVEHLVMDGDIKFDIINGIKWSDFKKNIVLLNEPQELETLKVEGNIVIEGALTIKSLNSLNFPDDYLLANGPRSSVVRAEKEFVNSLSANSVDTEGLINGQNPLDAITLMDQQDWQGFPVFNHLEVSEKLELHGTARGRNVEGFPSNPTLQESRIIDASCIFNELQVNGPIVLKGDLDEEPLALLLKDIVQRPDDPLEEIRISSIKSFGEVQFPNDFLLEENRINGIETEKFVTTHTEQNLQLDSLEGYVYFYNLTIDGLYDGINLEDFLKDVITLDKPVDFGSTELVFENITFQADTLVVLKNLNGVGVQNSFQTLKEDLIVDSVEFNALHAEQAEFSGDIMGPGLLNGVNLKSFVDARSWHEPPVQGNLFVQELVAPLGIHADELHGINSEDLLEFLQTIDDLPEMVLSGQIQVDHISVLGDVQLHKVNGLRFDEELQMSVIWLNRQNHLSTNLTFQNPLQIKGDLKIEGNYENQNFKALLNDFVWKDKNSSIVHITATKSFLNQVKVLQMAHIEAINGKEITNLAKKWQENVFQGSVKIKGNLITSELEVWGPNSYINTRSLEEILFYDPKLNNFVLKGSIAFDSPVHLEDLTVLESYQFIPNVSNFFESLIDKSQPCQLTGSNTFTGRITIDQGLHVNQLNGINVDDLFNNLVLIQGVDRVIVNSPVKFQDFLQINQISIMQNLETHELNGNPLEHWLQDTLRVDRDEQIPHYLHMSKGSLDGNNLRVNFLNNINLERIITLNTPQVFNESIQMSDVFVRDLMEVKGSVNGYDLEREYKNTLMIYGGQHIFTPLTIQSLEVLGDLKINCLVNKNKNLSDVATLHGDLELESPVYFRSLYAPKVMAKDLVSGIDLNKWFNTALRSQGKPQQYITGKWKTSLLTVEPAREYDFHYDDMNAVYPWESHSFIRNVRSSEESAEQLCKVLKDLWKKLKQKTIRIKYIEEDLNIENIRIDAMAERRKILSASLGIDVILFLNLDCMTFIYKWKKENNLFILLSSYESGYVDEVIVLPSEDPEELKFITNYESAEPMNCSLKGLNLWSSNNTNNNTKHERHFGEDIKDILYDPWNTQDSNESLILLVTQGKVMELNLATNERKEKYHIFSNEHHENDSSYQFLKSKEESLQDLAVTNGKKTIYLNYQKVVKTKKAINERKFSLMFPSIEMNENLPISLLKPNTTLARNLTLKDFSHTILRMLADLIKKLSNQIQITQLTIPETDLYDEHLIPDFVELMKQLKKQTIYTEKQLNLNLSLVKIPENPAQVLAVRVLFIIWPKVLELEEIQKIFTGNKTENLSMVLKLKETFGNLMQEVLQKAYPPESKDDQDGLSNTVQVIHFYQKKLHDLGNLLQNQSQEEEGELLASASHRHQQFLNNNFPHTALIHPITEILPIIVGSTNNSLRLLAICKSYNSIIPGNHSSIYLHAENLKSQPFQIIPANQPRSLIAIRLGSETLLAFIENCCRVQVWKYQGVQGFIRYANFQSESHITQLLTISLPQKVDAEEGKVEDSRQYLLLLLRNNIKFYNIVMQGRLYNPPPLPC